MLSLSEMLQAYQCCKEVVAITSSFDIGAGKTLRKLDKDELVEVLDSAKVDEKCGLARIKARALIDDKVGWLTLKGNQGT